MWFCSRQGKARHGLARPGKARQGLAWLGKAWLGAARQGRGAPLLRGGTLIDWKLGKGSEMDFYEVEQGCWWGPFTNEESSGMICGVPGDFTAPALKSGVRRLDREDLAAFQPELVESMEQFGRACYAKGFLARTEKGLVEVFADSDVQVFVGRVGEFMSRRYDEGAA